MKNITIAIQNKGRLSQDSEDYLRSLGFLFFRKGRELSVSVDGNKAEIIFLRDDVIPEYVNSGIVDFGIVGMDVWMETRKDNTKILKKLCFAGCSLVIAAPETSKIKSVKHLNGLRIATTYPRLLSAYLEENNVKAKIVEVQGSVEIAPRLNIADAICDITQTGDTLKNNGLKPIVTILESEAVLIGNSLSVKNSIILEKMQYENTKIG